MVRDYYGKRTCYAVYGWWLQWKKGHVIQYIVDYLWQKGHVIQHMVDDLWQKGTCYTTYSWWLLWQKRATVIHQTKLTTTTTAKKSHFLLIMTFKMTASQYIPNDLTASQAQTITNSGIRGYSISVLLPRQPCITLPYNSAVWWYRCSLTWCVWSQPYLVYRCRIIRVDHN